MAEWGSPWGAATPTLWGAGGSILPDPTFPMGVTGPDIVFFGESETGDWTELATNLSGYPSGDFTAGAGWIYVDPFDRAAGTGGTFSFEAVCRFNRDDVCHLMLWDDVYIRIDTQDIVVEAGGGAQTYTIESCSGAREVFLVTWSMEPNPLTTGAADLMRSEVWIYNYDDDAWEGFMWTHALATMSNAAELIVGASSIAGADAWVDEIYAVRIGRYFHASSENRTVFVEEPSTPTLHGVDRLEWPVPTSDSGLGNDGEFAGPVYAMAAKHTHSQDMRLHGPLVNVIGSGAWSDESTWTTPDHDDANYQLHLETLERVPVPPGCNRVHVRAHVQVNGTVRFKAWVGNGPGYLSKPAPTPAAITVDQTTVAVTVAAAHGTGDTGGQWIDLDVLFVEPDGDGYIYVVLLAFDFVPVSTWRWRAWNVEPLLDTTQDVIGGGGGFG